MHLFWKRGSVGVALGHLVFGEGFCSQLGLGSKNISTSFYNVQMRFVIKLNRHLNACS